MTLRPREMLVGGGGSSVNSMLSGESVKTYPKDNKSQNMKNDYPKLFMQEFRSSHLCKNWKMIQLETFNCSLLSLGTSVNLVGQSYFN